jgi:hypothetical protein
MIPVAWREPFSLGDAYRDLRPCGESIGEIVRSIPTLPPGFPGRGVVCVNGEPVPRLMWDHVRPKTSTAELPVIVTLHYPLAGGGEKGGSGAKSVIALVAAVALTALTAGIAGGAFAVGGLFAAGSFSAQLLAGAVSVAGALLISAISAPPTAKAKNDSSGEDNRTAASADGNVIAPAGAITRVIGTRRVFPPLAGDPIVEQYPGGDQYVEACYILNGPHLLEDVRLGSTHIEDAEDVEYELREGWGDDEPVTLTVRQGRQNPIQTEMSSTTVSPEDQQRLLHQEDPTSDLPVWHGFSSAVNPDEVWLHLSLPGGLYLQSDTTNDKSIAFRVRARPHGTSTWINFPEFHYSGRTPTQRKLAINFLWETWPGISPAIPTRNGFIYATRLAPAQTEIPVGTAWTADTYFDDGAGNNYVYATLENATRIRNMSLYEEKVEFYLDEATFPRGGIWEFEIKRSAPFDTSSFTKTNYNYNGPNGAGIYDFFGYSNTAGNLEIPLDRTDIVDTVGMTLVQSIWNEHPIAGTGLATISIRALNKRVESLSVLASGYVRDWDGTGWNTWTTTSNPAPHYADILSGDLNLDPLPDDLRDDDGLAAWRTLCTANDWKADILVEDMRIDDILGLLASCGYARPYQSEVYGVTVDKDHTDDDIVQMFSPRNSSNFRSEKSFVRLPDGFVVTFRDIDQNYEQAQVIVYAEGYTGGPGGMLEAVTYDGIVEEEKIRIRAKFDLDQAELRSTFHYLDTDMEAIVCRKGDLVVVQHDVISKRAGSALVKSLVTTTDSITGMVLDSIIPVFNEADMHGVTDMHSVDDMHMVGLTTGVAIRHNDGTFTVHQVSEATGETDTITLVTPVADDGTIDALEDTEYISGAQLVCGGMESIYSRLLVAEISPDRDMTYRLTLVDEAPELVRA